MNAIEAMSGISDRPRELWVSSHKTTDVRAEWEEANLRG
jgi:hypothetical protein